MTRLLTRSTGKWYDGEPVNGSFYTKSIDLQRYEGLAFQLNWSGGGVIDGTVEVEVSLDNENFVPDSCSTTEIDGDTGTHVYNIHDFHYRYVRLHINLTSGVTNFDIYVNNRVRD